MACLLRFLKKNKGKKWGKNRGEKQAEKAKISTTK
jgi:hypothetical protein